MHILLVHGGGHNENCWDDLKPYLKVRDINVHTITLRGHEAEKPMSGYQTSMSSYAEDVCYKAERIPEKCVLLGHSIGGLVISKAAEDKPDLFKRLIYLNAYVPKKEGSSIASLTAKHLGNIGIFAPSLHLGQGTGGLSLKKQKKFFYNEYKGDLAKLTKRNTCPQPLRPNFSKVGWTDKKLGSIPKDYIGCTYDECIQIDAQREMQKNMDFSKAITLESDHSPFSCMPEKLADSILELASQN